MFAQKSSSKLSVFHIQNCIRWTFFLRFGCFAFLFGEKIREQRKVNAKTGYNHYMFKIPKELLCFVIVGVAVCLSPKSSAYFWVVRWFKFFWIIKNSKKIATNDLRSNTEKIPIVFSESAMVPLFFMYIVNHVTVKSFLTPDNLLRYTALHQQLEDIYILGYMEREKN